MEFNCIKTMRIAPYAAVAPKASNGLATVTTLSMMVKITMKRVMITSRFCKFGFPNEICCNIHRGAMSIPRPMTIAAQVTNLSILVSVLYIVVFASKHSSGL